MAAVARHDLTREVQTRQRSHDGLLGAHWSQLAYKRNVAPVLNFHAKLLQLLYHQLFESYFVNIHYGVT